MPAKRLFRSPRVALPVAWAPERTSPPVGAGWEGSLGGELSAGRGDLPAIGASGSGCGAAAGFAKAGAAIGVRSVRRAFGSALA